MGKKLKWKGQAGLLEHTRRWLKYEFTSKVEIVLPELDATKIVTYNFHVDDLQVTHRYDMKLVRAILY